MDNQAAAKTLALALADAYVLMLKTQAVHWNVTGDRFVAIHNLTEVQYTDLFNAVDEIAERIRALEEAAPSTLAQFLEDTALNEGTGGSEPVAMIQSLLKANQKVSDRLREFIDVMDNLDDYASEDLLIGRLKVHDKNAWMYKSILLDMGHNPTPNDPDKSDKEKNKPQKSKEEKSKEEKKEDKSKSKAKETPAEPKKDKKEKHSEPNSPEPGDPEPTSSEHASPGQASNEPAPAKSSSRRLSRDIGETA